MSICIIKTVHKTLEIFVNSSLEYHFYENNILNMHQYR